MARFASWLARRVERSPELHLTLVAGLVLAAVGLAQMGKLSVILALLAFGMFTRSDRNRHDLVNVDLGRASRLFYIVLFVITGASLPPAALESAGWAALAFVAARAAGKFVGVLVIAPLGGLKWRQAVGLGAALLPMSTLSLLLLHDVVRLYPQAATELTAIVLAGLVVMELAGPVATQWGLRLAGETAPAAGADAAVRDIAPPVGQQLKEEAMPLEFTTSRALTFGVELELMVLNTRDYNLTRGAPDLLARLAKAALPSEVKPEITESMIEVNSRGA